MLSVEVHIESQLQGRDVVEMVFKAEYRMVEVEFLFTYSTSKDFC